MCDHSSPRARRVPPGRSSLPVPPVLPRLLFPGRRSPRPTYLLYGSCTATLSCHCVGDATSEASNLILQLRRERKREKVCLCVRVYVYACARKVEKSSARVIRRWSGYRRGLYRFANDDDVVLVAVVLLVPSPRRACVPRPRFLKTRPIVARYRFSLNSRGS